MSGEETVQVVDGEEGGDRSEFKMCMYLNVITAATIISSTKICRYVM